MIGRDSIYQQIERDAEMIGVEHQQVVYTEPTQIPTHPKKKPLLLRHFLMVGESEVGLDKEGGGEKQNGGEYCKIMGN